MDTLSSDKLVLSIVVSVILVVLVHELGHMLFGLLTREPLKEIFIGLPVRPRIILRLAGIKLSLSPYLVAVGIDYKHRLVDIPLGHSLGIVLAGPLTNLFFALLAVFALGSVGLWHGADPAHLIYLDRSWSSRGLEFWLLWTFWLNLIAALTNLVPIVPLDGGLALELVLLAFYRKLWPDNWPAAADFCARLEKAGERLILPLSLVLFGLGLYWLAGLYTLLSSAP